MANERAKELFKDESFIQELGATQTAEEAQKLFESKGGEITVDELKVIRATLRQKAGEKLEADELDLVAGGVGASVLIGNWIIETVTPKIGNFLRNW